MHSEGILCGELKHGPLAMIDPDMRVLMVCTKDKLYTKVMNGIQQVNARQVSIVEHRYVISFYELCPPLSWGHNNQPK